MQNKTKATAIALFLVLTITASIFALPTVSAHYPKWELPQWAYISVGPNPIGVNEAAIIVFWSNQYPPTANGPYGDRWHGMTVTVTKPDGTQETLGPFNSDPVGSQWAKYTPTQTGTYTFQAHIPKQTVTLENPNPSQSGISIQGWEYVNDTYAAADSEVFSITVQQEQTQGWVESTQTEYWTRPINNMNREWVDIASFASGWGPSMQWPLGSSGGNTANFAWGKGPESGHILWARPYWLGGIMDARYKDIYGADGYYTGLSYEPYGLNPGGGIIVGGKFFYANRAPPRFGYYAVDLYTGQTIWYRNTTGPIKEQEFTLLSNGSLQSGSGFDQSGALTQGLFGGVTWGITLPMDLPNQHGGFTYIATTSAERGTAASPPSTWQLYDAWTGNYISEVKNVITSGGTFASDSGGDTISYQAIDYGPMVANITKALATRGLNLSTVKDPRTGLSYTLNAVGISTANIQTAVTWVNNSITDPASILRKATKDLGYADWNNYLTLAQVTNILDKIKITWDQLATQWVTLGVTPTYFQVRLESDYGINIPNDWRFRVWNFTQAIMYHDSFVSNQMWMWRPYLNYTYNGANGFSLVKNMPNLRGPVNKIDNQTASLRALRDGDFAIYATAGINDERTTGPSALGPPVVAEFIKMNLKKGEEGTMIWNKTLTPPFSIPTAVGATVDPTAVALGVSARGVLLTGVYPEDDVILFRQEMTQDIWAYSLSTGDLLWHINNLKDQFNFYGMTITYYLQLHRIFVTGYAGIVRAFDIRNGTELWNYTAPGIGFESPYGNYPLNVGKIADGKLYLYSSEHSPTMPLWRGSMLRAIDADTGKEYFKIGHWGTSFALADGILIGLDLYDNRIYAYGKGPSSTTVSTAPTVNGKDVVITGTVMDVSAGTKQREDSQLGVLGTEQAGRFPNGLPAISDEDQSAWMEYVYKQQEGARTPNAKGVDVTLTAIDPNGNTQNIGTATSDRSGAYSIQWTPPVPGKYTVIATFAGSKSYYPSYAETAFGVSEAAPTPAPPTQPTAAADNTATIIGSAIAVIAAVGIVGLLLLRKRP